MMPTRSYLTSRVGLPSLFLTGAIAFLLTSQPVVAQNAEQDSLKYWIFFTDKATGAGKTEQVLVSEKALNRRYRRSSIDPGSLDRSVHPGYVARLALEGIEPVHSSRWLNAVSAFLTPADALRIADLPFVKKIRPVARTTVQEAHKLTASPVPLQTFPRLDYGTSWTQLNRTNAVIPLEQGINGAGVRLGIIDTHVGDFQHKVFDRMRAEGRIIESRDFTGMYDEGNRHAQFVLSVAAGFYEGYLIGPAHGADILHARAEFTSSETRQEEDNLVAALEWMEVEGVDVVNISLSYTIFDFGIGNYTLADMDGDTAIATIAADIAAGLGVVVVVSAGNHASFPGDTEPCPPDKCWYFVGSPADGHSVITVGATTPDDRKATFSSFGPTADGRTKPDLSAMGTNITYANDRISPFCDNGFCGNGSGTSFSAPLVAAIAAQILQVNPNLTPIQVREILRQTARVPLDPPSSYGHFPNNSLGWGIVDAGVAIAMAAAMTVAIDEPAHLPTASSISAPYPIPASGVLRFDIVARSPGHSATLELFDLLGRRVRLLTMNSVAQGKSSLEFNLDALNTGLYAYRLLLGEKSETGTLVVIK